MLRQPQKTTLLLLRAFNQNVPASILLRHAQLVPSTTGFVSYGSSRMFTTKKDDEKAPDVESTEKPKRVRKTKEISAETEAD